MQKLNLGWVLSIERLAELTARDPKRVVRPVSPRWVMRPVLLPKRERPARSPPKKRRRR